MRYSDLFRSSVVLIALFFFAGCAKDRPDKFVQGQGLGLDTKASLDGMMYSLTTGDVIGRAESTKAEKIRISDSVENVNHFDLVKYTTDAKLLGSVPFRGRSNFNYQVRYELESKLLKIYKVGFKNDIPFQELSYGKVLPDGRIAVPLVGYAIRGFYRLENRLNDDDENTHEVMEVEERDPAKATHVRIDYNSKTAFKAIQKIDVYPASLFTGDWYFTETVVDNASKSLGDSLGSSMHSDPMKVAIIKFRHTATHLKGFDLSQDKRINELGDELTQGSLIDIPVKRKAFRTKDAGREGSFEEEEALEVPDLEKPYLAMEMEKIVGAAVNGKDSDRVRLVDVELDNNYIGLTYVQYGEKGLQDNIRVKFSFLKKNPRDYQVRPYPRFDRNNGFGMFSVIEPRIRNSEVDETAEVEKLIHVARFNPKNKEIVYHFSNLTSKERWVRDLGVKAIAHWNDAFQKAGTGIAIRLDESSEMTLGDLRGNVLNLIDAPGGATPVRGFGPSLADPFTGEILAATTNVHLPSLREEIVGSLQNYVLYKAEKVQLPAGLFALGEIGAAPRNTLATVPSSLLKDSVKENSGHSSPIHFASLDSQGVLSTKVLPEAKTLSLYQGWIKNGDYLKQPGSCSESLSMTPRFEEIEAVCGDSLKLNIENARKGNRSLAEVDADNQRYYACANRIIPGHAMSTIVHELGHNFGLRHVFNGNADVANFWTGADGVDMKLVGQSSSVMDYRGDSEAVLQIPGKMDIATIRYGYTDAIEMADGSVAKISPRLSLEDNERILGKKRRAFKYCTDEHAELNVDPMCRRWDTGSNPIEVVDNIIRQFWSEYPFVFYRHGRRSLPDANALGMHFVRNTATPLKRFYDEWRFALGDYIGKKDAYLGAFDSAAYAKVMDRMSKDAQFKEKYDTLRPAAEKAFSFLLGLAQSNNNVCYITKGEVAVVEFETLRRNIYNANGLIITSCQDQAVLSHYGVNAEQVRSVGYPLEEIRYSLRPEDATEPYDVAGLLTVRVNAFLHLAVRSPYNLKSIDRGITPSFIDEPQYRDQISQWLMDRLIKGVKLGVSMNEQSVPLFESEKVLVQNLFKLFRNGLSVPGQATISQLRQAPYIAMATIDPSVVQTAVQRYKVAGRYLVTTGPENKHASTMLQHLGNLDELNKMLSLHSEGKVPDFIMLHDAFGNFANAFGSGQVQVQALAEASSGLMQSIDDWMNRPSPLSAQEKAALLESLLGDGLKNLAATFEKIQKKGGLDKDLAQLLFKNVTEIKNSIVELAATDSNKDLYAAVAAKGAHLSEKLQSQFNDEVKPILEYQKEFSAQQDLLLSILMGSQAE